MVNIFLSTENSFNSYFILLYSSMTRILPFIKFDKSIYVQLFFGFRLIKTRLKTFRLIEYLLLYLIVLVLSRWVYTYLERNTLSFKLNHLSTIMKITFYIISFK